MVGQCALIRAVGGPADQHEAPVAIAAIDITMLVDLQPDARVAKRCRGSAADTAGTVAGNAGMIDKGGFRRSDGHSRRITTKGASFQPLYAAPPLAQ